MLLVASINKNIMIKDFIKSNFEKVIEIQNSFDHDSKMIKYAANKSLNNDMVKSWMTQYNLFQGINNESRINIANAFINYNENIKSDNSINIKTHFQDLHLELFKINNRKWLSATSKLLWCLYPNQIVIYDSFVEKAVTVLQCIDPDLVLLPRISNCPKLKNESDIELVTDYYMNYQDIVKKILFKNQDIITEMKSKYDLKYNYDIRIIDKLLWLLGDADSTIILGKTICKIRNR